MNKKMMKILLIILNLLLISGTVFAEEEFYENDVTPPVGRITIVGATKVNNINYVDRQKVELQIYAHDDMCLDSEIKYHLSSAEISNTSKITSWEDYYSGKTVEFTLPNTSSLNTIYIVFKDKNGNTSLIFSDLNQEIIYDLNATDATEAPTGVANTRTYGAPFVVTTQAPKREGYYFLGWSTEKDANKASYGQGDIIPADASLGSETSATLYAIWTSETSGLPDLADVVEVGDYVNYPVYYDNVATYGTSYIAKHTGWRVISKDVDIDGTVSEGTVNLVSAGVPLTYYHPSGKTTDSVTNLATNFLGTPFSASNTIGFQKTGFNPFQSLEEVFTNIYTATYESDTPVTYPTYSTNTVTATKTAGTLKVRAMTKADLDKVYDPTGASVTASSTYVKDAKYQDLLAIPCSDKTSYYAYYWLASAYSSSYLWDVSNDGRVYYFGISYEYGVRPVVSLKSNVKATGRDMIGAWNIEI